MLILRSPKGGCCSISDDLSCSCKLSPYENRGPTANQSEEAINIVTQTSKEIKAVYKKYIKTSVRAGYAPSVWKRAHAKGVPTRIKRDEDQGLVSSEEVWTNPVIYCEIIYFRGSNFRGFMKMGTFVGT